MPFWVSPEGTRYEWSGNARAFCSKCRVVFNSVTAFDAHLNRPLSPKGRGLPGAAAHDYSWMPKNNAGYYVIALWEDKSLPSWGKE